MKGKDMCPMNKYELVFDDKIDEKQQIEQAVRKYQGSPMSKDGHTSNQL